MAGGGTPTHQPPIRPGSPNRTQPPYGGWPAPFPGATEPPPQPVRTSSTTIAPPDPSVADEVTHESPTPDGFEHLTTPGTMCPCWPSVRSLRDGKRLTLVVVHHGAGERP